MSDVWTIFKREFRAFFDSPVAYIFITIFLLVTNGLFFLTFFEANEANLRGLLASSSSFFCCLCRL